MKFALSILISFSALAQTNPFAARSTPLALDLNADHERADCGQIDLRPEFAQRNLPDRRHQDTTGWCYAFVGADLVSYEVRQNVSPADIARQYINNATPEHLASLDAVRRNPVAQFQPLGGGFTKTAVEATRPGGFCLESEFPSEDYSWSEEQERAMIAMYPNKNDRPDECLYTENIVPLFTGIPVRELLGLVHSDDFRRILNQLPNSVCQSRISLPENLRIQNVARKGREPYNDRRHESFYQRIDSVLTGNRPVSLSINSSIFNRPMESLRSLADAGHQVVLAGRRLNPATGRCEYLIRNSESSCQNYYSEYECENNHVWIPREIVRMGTFGADFITSDSAD